MPTATATCPLGVSGLAWAAGAHRPAPAPRRAPQPGSEGRGLGTPPAPWAQLPSAPPSSRDSAALCFGVSSRTVGSRLSSTVLGRPALPPKCQLPAPEGPAEWAASYTSLPQPSRLDRGSGQKAGGRMAVGVPGPQLTAHPPGAALSGVGRLWKGPRALHAPQPGAEGGAGAWSPGPEAA